MSRLAHNLYLLFLLAILVVGLAVWCYERQVPSSKAGAEVIEHQQLTSPDNRHVEHVTLRAGKLGDIGFTISLPDPLPQEKLPVLIVLGGLGTGEDNIRQIHDAGNNVIVGYDWPMPVKAPDAVDFLLHAPMLYNAVMTVPGQIATAVEWMAGQDWADQSRISILGYSLGALAAPAAQDEIQNGRRLVHSTILAYGGAPLGALFAADTHINLIFRVAMAPLIDFILHPLQPDLHLIRLEGSFLILEGKDDNLIPESARARLREAVPQPKKIIDFEGDHMGVGPDKDVLLQQIIDTSRQWLLEEEAVNPL